MDAIFKALNDPTRRRMLDLLRQRDGRTLGELVEEAELTRFGVMKHLKVLEEAHLVATRRDGRFKRHYLNAAPLQTVIDRWIEPLLAKPAARMALDLKAVLEGDDKMTKPDFLLETFIRTTSEKLWAALTEPEIIGAYYIAGAKPKAPITGPGRVSYDGPDGAPMLTGEVLAFEPVSRLEMTFEPHWSGPSPAASRVVYEIEEAGAACKLSILHFGLSDEERGVRKGWARIASALKTLLETGAPLKLAG